MWVEAPKDFLIMALPRKEEVYKNGLIEIDDEIVDEILWLWENGIHTIGCCSGHGTRQGYIQVERVDLQKMLDLGYEIYVYEEGFGGADRFDAFVPKTEIKKETDASVSFRYTP